MYEFTITQNTGVFMHIVQIKIAYIILKMFLLGVNNMYTFKTNALFKKHWNKKGGKSIRKITQNNILFCKNMILLNLRSK